MSMLPATIAVAEILISWWSGLPDCVLVSLSVVFRVKSNHLVDQWCGSALFPKYPRCNLNSITLYLYCQISSLSYVSEGWQNVFLWCSVKSGQIRNMESARVSMGGQVKKYVGSYSYITTNSQWLLLAWMIIFSRHLKMSGIHQQPSSVQQH